MAKSRISKTSKKRLLVFGTLSIFIICCFLFNLFFNGYQLYSLNDTHKGLDNQLNNLKREEKILSSEIEKLQDDDYIAKYARETYSYSKDGEYIIKINDKDEIKDEEKSTLFNFDYNYFIYIGAGIIILILIYAIRKKK